MCVGCGFLVVVVVCGVLFVVRCVLFVVCWCMRALCRVLFACCWLLVVVCRLLLVSVSFSIRCVPFVVRRSLVV